MSSSSLKTAPFTLLLSEIFPPIAGGSGRWLYEVYRRFPVGKLAIVNQQTVDPIGSDPEFVRRIDFSLCDTGGFSFAGAREYRKLKRQIDTVLADQPRPTVCQAARVLPEGWLAWRWRLRGGPAYHCFAHGEEINLQGVVDGGVMSSRQHRWMARLVLRGAARVIANSHNTAQMLRRQWGIRQEKIVVVHPGVDTQYFHPAAPCVDIRRQLGWADAPVILSVGRLQRRKGHDQLIAGLASIRAAIPGTLLAIAGSGEEEERLRELAYANGVADAVRWYTAAADDEILQMYQQCDLFVLANRQVGSDVEGFGMVLLEAAACGKPTVAGRSGGTCEAIVDGTTGKLVDATDQRKLATAIIALLQDGELRHRWGTAGRKRVEELFDWSQLTNQIASVICNG